MGSLPIAGPAAPDGRSMVSAQHAERRPAVSLEHLLNGDRFAAYILDGILTGPTFPSSLP